MKDTTESVPPNNEEARPPISPIPVPTPITPTLVTDCQDLKGLFEELTVPVFIAGKRLEFKARLLNAEESERIEDLLNDVVPKLVKGTDGKEYYDTQEKTYVREVRQTRKKARALGLYLAVPAFAKGKPALTDVNKIYEWVQSQAVETVLEALWTVVSSDGRGLEEAINFTPTSASENG